MKDLDSCSSLYFFTGPDGTMVMGAPLGGVTTGAVKHARSERSELRDAISGANAARSLAQGGYMAIPMQMDEVPQDLDGTETKIVIGQINSGGP